jgi:hypothetical protein
MENEDIPGKRRSRRQGYKQETTTAISSEPGEVSTAV